jgi:hypothetical protein
MQPSKPLLLSAAIVSLALSGCASTPKAPPAFDANASAAAQAATFIADNGKTKSLATIKRVAVTGCNVLFAENSSASASTGGGLFSTAGNTVRSESRVSVLYSLKNISDAQQQTMANAICANAEDRLRTAGFEVVNTAELLKNETFKALLIAGKASPFNFKAPGKGSSTTYNVFAPTGYTVYDPRYIGVVGGLGQAFKAAGGNSAAQLEARLMKELNASAVSINVLIDFSELKSDGHQRGILNKDSASVKHGVNLGITGLVDFKAFDKLKCWKRFGKDECMLNGVATTFNSKIPVTTNEKFYKDVANATTTGDKAAAAFTKGLSMLAAAGGLSGTTSYNITRYNVNAEPAQFESVARTGVNGFLDMVFLSAKAK